MLAMASLLFGGDRRLKSRVATLASIVVAAGKVDGVDVGGAMGRIGGVKDEELAWLRGSPAGSFVGVDKGRVPLMTDEATEPTEPTVNDPSDLEGDEFLRLQHEKKMNYAHNMASLATTHMKRDLSKTGLNVSEEEALPQFEHVKEIYGHMYDSFQQDNSTNATETRPSEYDAIRFMNDRMDGDGNSTITNDVWLCKDMFRKSVDIPDESQMNLTLDDIQLISEYCYDDMNRRNLQAIGYDFQEFCPTFRTLLPLRFQVLPPDITQNLTSLCNFVVDTIFVTAGEPECLLRMEEVHLRNAFNSGREASFPGIVESTTFNESYVGACISHESPFFFDLDNCTESMLAVEEVSRNFYEGNETTINFMSDLCDAFGLPLPHPNETIPLRYANPHTHHKPGGMANLRIRHAFSDLFFYSSHYKHGFMDKYGQYIENPNDSLFDPEAAITSFVVEGEGNIFEIGKEVGSWCTDTAKQLKLDTCQQFFLFCSGLAYSVGVGADASIAGASIGGGIDFGYGVSSSGSGYESNPNEYRNVYEESFVWGICGSIGSSGSFSGDSVDPKKTANDAKTKTYSDKASDMDAGVSIGVSGGFWKQVGNIPGFAQVIEVSIQVFIVEVGISLVETFGSDNNDPSTYWNPDVSQGFNGFMFNVGVSWPATVADIDINTDLKCFGDIIGDINSEQKVGRITWKEVDMSKKHLCGKNQYSFDFSDTGDAHASTSTGLSTYYYKTKWDWDNRKNRQWIAHYCGNLLTGIIEDMGHGDHFYNQEVYGVGVVAHGDDAYTLGDLKLFQNFGSAMPGADDWIQLYQFKDQSFCLSTWDTGCYPNIEFQVFGRMGSDVRWRSGNGDQASNRAPHSSQCPRKYSINVGQACWQVQWTHNIDGSCKLKNGHWLTMGGGYNYGPGRHSSKLMGIPVGWSWEQSCRECKDFLGSYWLKWSNCAKDAANTGIWLEYEATVRTSTVCSPSSGVTFDWNSGAGWQWSKVHNAGDNWDQACQHVRNWLWNNGYSYMNSCRKDLTGIYIDYYPDANWNPWSTSTGSGGGDICDNYIDFQRGGWCAHSTGHLSKETCNGIDYIKCSDEGGLSGYRRCDGGDTPSHMAWPNGYCGDICDDLAYESKKAGWCTHSTGHVSKETCNGVGYIRCTDGYGNSGYRKCDGGVTPDHMKWPNGYC